MTLSERLSQLVAESGRSQAWVARGAGISEPHLCNLLNGKIKSPGIHIADRLAKVLGVTVDDLLHPAESVVNAGLSIRPIACIRCHGSISLGLIPHLAGDLQVGWIYSCNNCHPLLTGAKISVQSRPPKEVT